MNILNVTTMRGLRGGDAQMYTIYNLLKSKTDLQQYILCPEDADLAKMCVEDNANLITYKHDGYKKINAIKTIIKSCNVYKIDVLHIHDSSALTYSLIAIKFLKNKPKLILSRKRNNKIKPFFLNRYKYSHPAITKIVSVSKAVEAIFDAIIKDKSRLLTIYDAIDVKKVCEAKNKMLLHQEYKLDENAIIVGNIAGLDDQKDLFTFIDTAKKIMQEAENFPQIKFFIFGKGPKKDELQQYINNQQLEDNVVLAGFRTDVLSILPEFDILLMSSIEEGLPLSIYEAFAARVPVISTDAGGIKEVVQNDVTGFVAPIKDADQLAKLCLKILQDPKLKQIITENAFNLVQKNHDLSNFEHNYYTFYQSLK